MEVYGEKQSPESEEFLLIRVEWCREGESFQNRWLPFGAGVGWARCRVGEGGGAGDGKSGNREVDRRRNIAGVFGEL